ncbi:hypothetical protein CEXT_663231 [Caerostris extrusa]|uniref:Uncharacterized protein n=1 Tax=Caerostris extrusa TaxID=172846 RepID=A0AAV4X7Y8_CAEEX|nr:hypothetical protein CEXT_663231 [Caerostris extrusa]
MISMADRLNAWNSNQLTEAKKIFFELGELFSDEKNWKINWLTRLFSFGQRWVERSRNMDVHIGLGEGNTLFVFCCGHFFLKVNLEFLGVYK